MLSSTAGGQQHREDRDSDSDSNSNSSIGRKVLYNGFNRVFSFALCGGAAVQPCQEERVEESAAAVPRQPGAAAAAIVID